jgi:hypothetical protein
VLSGIGYKVVFGKKRTGFAMEPVIDYVWPFYSTLPVKSFDFDKLFGFVAMSAKGFRAGIYMGFAF